MNTSMQPSAWDILRNQVLPTARIRDVDRSAIEQFSMNSLVLMENAAINSVRWITERFPSRPQTVVLCGSGNNGGDGIAITRHLRAQGWGCEGFVLGPLDKLSPDARANAQILASPGSGLHLLDPSDFAQAFDSIKSSQLIVDALLGTGASGSPRSPMSAWIEAANDSAATRIAIDIPTGINADTGEICSPYFRASATLTFVALKPAMAQAHSAELFGRIEVLPIGIPEQLITQLVTSK